MTIIFFDLDGTLRETKSGDKFINNPEDQKPIQGAEEAIAYYSSKYLCIGITNQGGVKAGFKSLENCIEEQQITLEMFDGLERIFFCPDDGWSCVEVHRKYIKNYTGSNFRKPGSQMINLAAADAKAKENSWMIGDRPEDFEAANNAGINFMWASIMLDKFVPGIHQRDVGNIDREDLLRFLSL